MCGWVRDGEVCEFAGGERSSRSSDAMKRERERERMFACFIHIYIYIYIYISVSVYIVLIIVSLFLRVRNLIVIFFLRVVVREDDNFR